MSKLIVKKYLVSFVVLMILIENII